MDGRAEAPGAGTVLNALATGRGSAFAIDLTVTADVSLDADAESVTGTIGEDADADTALVERCVELVVAEFADEEFGGTVETASEIPLAAGLKSSSAAANATVLATLDALDAVDDVTLEDAARIGVRAARETGVTVTGAFDDASASMLGGLTVTDNERDVVLARDDPDWDVLVWTPPERAYSADADADRCARIAPVASVVEELAFAGRYGTAMTINGFAFCAALEQPTDPAVDALPLAEGVSLSGTGPSHVAVGDRDALTEVRELWTQRPGTTTLTTTRTTGGRVLTR